MLTRENGKIKKRHRNLSSSRIPTIPFFPNLFLLAHLPLPLLIPTPRTICCQSQTTSIVLAKFTRRNLFTLPKRKLFSFKLQTTISSWSGLYNCLQHILLVKTQTNKLTEGETAKQQNPTQPDNSSLRRFHSECLYFVPSSPLSGLHGRPGAFKISYLLHNSLSNRFRSYLKSFQSGLFITRSASTGSEIFNNTLSSSTENKALLISAASSPALISSREGPF